MCLVVLELAASPIASLVHLLLIFDLRSISLNNVKLKQHPSRDRCRVKVTQCCVNCVVFIAQTARLLEGIYHDILSHFRMIDGLLSHL